MHNFLGDVLILFPDPKVVTSNRRADKNLGA
ncbi:hypothetical protein F0726_00231 [Acidithiobacillus caldus]|nr:hypothetical protein F0726_00231 [Acidithiobacillus caldus]